MNVSTLKPFDLETVVRSARETGAVVTAEEHLRHGGFGEHCCGGVGGTLPCATFNGSNR